MKHFRPTRFRLSWLQLLLAALLAVFGYCSQGCRDQYPDEPEPCDASRIEGRWQGDFSPFWHYEFNPPRLRQWVEVGGTVVTEQHYVYGTSADTLWASGPGGERMWLLCFQGDTLAEVREWDVWKWSPVKVLRRE